MSESSVRARALGGVAAAVAAAALLAPTAAFADENLCVVCVLNPSANGALTVTGGSHITVINGGLAVNSSSSNAAVLSGGSKVNTFKNWVRGGRNVSGGASFTPTPVAFTGSVFNPAAGITTPSTSGPSRGSISTGGSTNRTVQPGVYGSISVGGGSKLTLSPGVYVITHGLDVSGGGHLSGHGVLLYFVNNAGAHLSGNSDTELFAAGGFDHMVIQFARGNHGQFKADDVDSVIDGEMYGPSARLEVQRLDDVTTDFIAFDTVEVHSGGNLHVIN